MSSLSGRKRDSASCACACRGHGEIHVTPSISSYLNAGWRGSRSNSARDRFIFKVGIHSSDIAIPQKVNVFASLYRRGGYNRRLPPAASRSLASLRALVPLLLGEFRARSARSLSPCTQGER